MQQNKILRLENDTLYLTYSWGILNQGICGHAFEVIDYFWILKDFFKIKILFCEDFDINLFKKAILNKYNFNNQEVDLIIENIIIKNRPKIVTGGYLLITDGNLMKDKNVVLKFKHIFMFSCGIKDNHLLLNENITVLQDYRIYESGVRTINYKKKILFDRLLEILEYNDANLIYISKNCRNLSDNFANLPNKKFIAVINKGDKYENIENIEFIESPVENIWKLFNKYYYTDVPRKFDCSPRFIAECKFYGREVVYLIDYFIEDKGLFWRKFDIDNDFESIKLTNNDELIRIISEQLLLDNHMGM